jgi:TP901 family phage tail tape measure protein
MGNLTSTLTMKLIDGVSAVAPKIEAALRRVHTSAQRAQGKTMVGAAAGGVGVGLAGLSRGLMGGVAAYVGGREAVEAYKGFASFERRMSRVGLTADATAAQTARAAQVVKTVAKDLALPQEDVLQGLEGLVAAGRTLPDAMKFLPAVAKTAQASGAAVSDIASTADALGTSLKIPADQMERMFDYLVQQGKAGKFELKDMARYLPSIAPAAAAVGMAGVEGANKIAALLQVVRQGTGTAEEAAASVQNIFAKMESEETAKRFKKMGVDLRKEMKAARASGKDLLDVFVDLSERALKGDLSKLPQLFSDQEFARGMRALLSRRGELQRLIADGLKNGLGAVNRDVSKITTDAEASLQRLANAWSEAKMSFAEAGDAAGVTTFLQGLTAELKTTAEQFRALKAIIEDVKNLKVKDAAEKGRDFIDGRTPEEKERDRIKGETREAVAEDHRKPRVYDPKIRELEESQAAIENSMLDPDNNRVQRKVLAARLQEVKSALAELRARASPGREWADVLPPLASGVQNNLPPSELRPHSRGRGSAPPSSKIFTPPPALPDASLGVKADEGAAAAAGQAAHAAAQRAADALGPIRFKSVVDAPAVSGAIGNKVSSGLDGTHSDNSGRR